MMLIHHRGAKAEHEEKALMMCAFPPKGQKNPKQNKKNQEVILRCLCWKNEQTCAEAAAVKAIRGRSHRFNVGVQWVDITLAETQRYGFCVRSQSAKLNRHLHED